MLVDKISISMLSGKPLINNISFYLNKGDKLALIGEEGNGKSTLLKVLYNPKLVEDYVVVSGIVNTLNNKLGYLPQLTPKEVLDQGAYSFLTSEILKSGNYDKLSDIYQYTSLFLLNKEILEHDQLISTLSGGEKVKIQIIKLLLDDPDILLLDEPSNDLDIGTLKWLELFILNSPQAIIFISHDELLLSKCANRILHLQMFKKKNEPSFNLENIPYLDYQEKLNVDYENQLAKALLERKIKEEKEEVLHKLHAKVEHRLNQAVRNPTQGRLLAKKMKVIKGQEKKLEKQELTKIPELEAPINVSFSSTNNKVHESFRLVDINNLSINIAERTLVKDINLTIVGPKKVAFIGKNGVGKTTFLKYLLNYLKQKELKVGYLPQNYFDELPINETPLGYLQSYLGYDKENEALIRNYLGALRFNKDEMLNSINELSGGQRCKLLIVKLVLEDNDVIVLDEPTRNLSPLSLPKVRELFSSYKGALICVTHDRLFIRYVMDTVYEVSENGLTQVEIEDIN